MITNHKIRLEETVSLIVGKCKSKLIMNSKNYKHYIPDLKLSIEQNTNIVPNNDFYYVVQDGKILEKCRTLKMAKEVFYKIVKEYGYKPKLEDSRPKDMRDYELDNYFLAKEVYWAESYKHKGKSGKGGRGGV